MELGLNMYKCGSRDCPPHPQYQLEEFDTMIFIQQDVAGVNTTSNLHPTSKKNGKHLGRTRLKMNYTVYEFLGDYWHGNPDKFTRDEFNKRVKKTFGELYDATIHRQNEILENGYKLVTMWEMDWKSKQQEV